MTNTISIKTYGWCFALINNRLAGIYFDEKGIFGYAYVTRNEYLTRKEQKRINADTEKFQFSYKRRMFKNKFTGEKLKLVEFNRQQELRRNQTKGWSCLFTYKE